MFTYLLVLTWGWRYFWNRENIRKRVSWNKRLRVRLLCTLCIGVSRNFCTSILAKILQNGAKFIQKVTPGFENHMRNLENFREAEKSLKSWDLMGYFCSKNTFLQLKHYMQKIYLTLLSTNCLKIHQMTYAIFETISLLHYTTPLYFLAQKLNTFYKSSSSKCKFSDFPVLALMFPKFFMSFFKQKVSLSSKFWSFFSVMRDHSSVFF